jgi:hypothetical protein
VAYIPKKLLKDTVLNAFERISHLIALGLMTCFVKSFKNIAHLAIFPFVWFFTLSSKWLRPKAYNFFLTIQIHCYLQRLLFTQISIKILLCLWKIIFMLQADGMNRVSLHNIDCNLNLRACAFVLVMVELFEETLLWFCWVFLCSRTSFWSLICYIYNRTNMWLH